MLEGAHDETRSHLVLLNHCGACCRLAPEERPEALAALSRAAELYLSMVAPDTVPISIRIPALPGHDSDLISSRQQPVQLVRAEDQYADAGDQPLPAANSLRPWRRQPRTA